MNPLKLTLIFSLFSLFANAQKAKITVNADKVENKLSKLIYGSNIEDVNHEIYGGFNRTSYLESRN
ncbi:hypothetical protein [Dyadobacter luticola]|uniref:TonB-dependent receptor n=1 Tax=Dyadobacter luticola TaxID=1979387 RepID=A0A5R9L0Q4_9BACT|nr:hypothetical protein [Dyadobacter luticola]TLV02114.1 hypothetical protein FEN17_00255 [Dyadobacter luticola]